MPAGQSNPSPATTSPWPVLLGPTAVGKTEVSLAAAVDLDAEIVSVDSRQIYRGMEIGSAAPSAGDRARVRHHLIAELDPGETLTAGEYGRRVRGVVAEIVARGKTPLLVGGSGLYLRAALGGLDEDLPRDPTLRRALRARVEREGVESVYAELRGLDPDTAATLSPRDGQRITRAMELIRLTGRRASELRTRGRRVTVPASIVVLDRKQADLEARIAARVDAMIGAGLEDEVRRLLERGFSTDQYALRSVGCAETIALFDRKCTREEWRNAIIKNTRRYAKRQRTWFRGIDGAVWLHLAEEDTVAQTTVRVLPGLTA